MDWDENNFEHRLANLEQTWATAERLGLPRSEDRKLWSRLRLELEFSGKPLTELESVALYALRWRETRNPHYIDAAVLCCQNAGIDPPRTLQALVAEVAALRFGGLTQGGTGKAIHNDQVLGEALRLLCGLHLTGAPVALAASKAARFVADQGLGKIYKASTLEKEYPKVYRRGDPSLEDRLRSARERAPAEEQKEWVRLLATLPEADDDLKGTTR